MKDRTSLALLKFLGLDPSCTEKVVLVLEKGDLPRVRVTSAIKPAPGAEAGLVRQVRDFDMVPHDETRAQRDELLGIRSMLSAAHSLVAVNAFPLARAPVPCPLCSAEVGHAQECLLIAG